MKKLLDETSDDLVRTLLESGVKHHPPPGNQAHLIAALGVGSAFGLFSAKASAWVGSGAGKVSLVSLALGVVGVLYAVSPEPARSPEAAPTRASALQQEQGRAFDAPGAPERPALESEVKTPAERLPDDARRKPARRAMARDKTRPTAVAVSDAKPIEGAGLDAEVRLVDQLRAAVLQKDRTLALRLIESYRATFGGGQLSQEVSDLAARVESRGAP